MHNSNIRKINFYSRSPQDVKNIISKTVSAAQKFSVDKGKSYVNEAWISKKIAGYQKVCDISLTSSPTKQPPPDLVQSPMSPSKRPRTASEPEPPSEAFGRGRRIKTENKFYPGALDFNFAVPHNDVDDNNDHDWRPEEKNVPLPKQGKNCNISYSETIRQARRFHLTDHQIAIIVNSVNK